MNAMKESIREFALSLVAYNRGVPNHVVSWDTLTLLSPALLEHPLTKMHTHLKSLKD